MFGPQLPLEFAIPPERSLDNFLGQESQPLIHTCRENLADRQHALIYLWGEAGQGKSHLLQGCCREASERGLRAIYVPLREALEYGPDALNGLESFDWLGLDDVQLIAGQDEWEIELFHLFNRAQVQNTLMQVTANAPVASLGIALPDLRSRLNWGPAFQVPELSDVEKLDFIIHQGHSRGLEISERTAAFLLNHIPRDLSRLLRTIEELDRAAMEAQRRITIPFIKACTGLQQDRSD